MKTYKSFCVYLTSTTLEVIKKTILVLGHLIGLNQNSWPIFENTAVPTEQPRLFRLVIKLPEFKIHEFNI